MNDVKKNTRRRYSRELKKLILAECTHPGASVASVALSHGINANVVHKWRRQVTGAGSLAPVMQPSFVPVSLPPASCAPAPDIRIELRRGATSVSLSWPLAGAEHCAVWMRELLK
jgi:transposase